MLRFVLLVLWSLASLKKTVAQYDICIYGGTSAGVIAAYTAARMGKKVILIEPGSQLGGLSSGGLGYTDIGNKYAITGLARDFYRRIGKHYGKFEQWIFEPHVAEQVFNDYIKKGKVPVMPGWRIREVIKSHSTITTIVIEKTSDVSQSKRVSAKMFIDCSYEGDLMAKAGVSYMVGRESNDQFKETYNGVQLMGGHQFPDGIDPYKIPGDPNSGLLWGITDSSLAKSGSGDRKLQAYNYRICLTNNPANRLPIERPDDYDSLRYELLLRLIAAQPSKRNLNDYFIISRMPGQKTDINNRGGFSSDMIGMNYNYPDASYAERAAIIRQHELYTKGLLYFYGHDQRVPEEMREQMLQWGYPKDEYKNNGHWSPQPYIRECRRMIGEYIMTQANCQGHEVVDDVIGMAAYTMDSHNCQRIVVNGFVKNEGNVEIGGFGPYPIAYRSIIPRREQCGNLYVPVCLSATHIAYGSIRMEPVFMVLAQSAAVAASLAIDGNKTVQQIDLKKLRAILTTDPLMDGSIPDILIDNDDSTVTLTGDWQRKTNEPSLGYSGNYGPSMFVSGDAAVPSVATFQPKITKTGLYQVYSYFPKIPNGASHTRFTIFDGNKNSTVTIQSESVKVEGQTSGEWVLLGTYHFSKGKKPYVAIANAGANGSVVADAILLTPAGKP